MTRYAIPKGPSADQLQRIRNYAIDHNEDPREAEEAYLRGFLASYDRWTEDEVEKQLDMERSGR